ncbi:MAG: T9SS type A sorting domain-containing protein, partial [bacterium]|nr:T9SS type A sorting domain-containing protein [bacterium]
ISPLISVAYPNPFRSQTILTLAVERDQAARVEVYNIKGQLVVVLFEGTARALAPELLLFDATGRPAGIYFVRAQGETFSLSRKIVLVK